MRYARLKKPRSVLQFQLDCWMGPFTGAFSFVGMSNHLLETIRANSQITVSLEECTMIDVEMTRAVLEQIALSKYPVGLMRELVLDGGGTWIDTTSA